MVGAASRAPKWRDAPAGTADGGVAGVCCGVATGDSDGPRRRRAVPGPASPGAGRRARAGGRDRRSGAPRRGAMSSADGGGHGRTPSGRVAPGRSRVVAGAEADADRDLQQQREDLLRERSEAQQQSRALQQELQAQRLKAEQERVAQEAYVRGVEDRAHREVDHAREEGKAITAELKAVGRHVEQLQRRLESTQNELSETQQRAVAQQVRADILEQQLTQMRQAPAVKRTPRIRKSKLKSDS